MTKKEFHQNSKLVLLKNAIKKMKRQLLAWEIILTNHGIHKGLVSRTYKELVLNNNYYDK